MAESSGFFDAEELVDGGYDREYVAEQWANYFKLFVGNGVFANPANTLKVVASSGLTVKVLPGWAWINGYWYHNDSELTLEIPTNLTLSSIQDGIFLRFDSANRVISALVGVNRTTVNRISPYYELKLAEVTVDVGVTSISDANITDTRTDSSVCGIVAGVIDQIDTTDLFAQYQAAFNAFMQGSGTEFDEWFDHMKDQLDSDAAGHLQAEVDEINEIIAPVQLTLTASQPYAIGEQFIYEGKLYTATSAIAEGATIVIGTNAALSAEIVKQIKSAKDSIGDLSDLDTEEKDSAVEAINEVNTKLSKTEVLIAYVQTSLTASKAYAEDEQFIYNGLLYKATASIAQGGTIVIGGNAELADSVTEQINNAVGKTALFIPTGGAVQSYDASRCIYTKVGNVTTVNFQLVLKSTATSGAIIINFADIGLTSIKGLEFSLGYSNVNDIVKIVATTNGYIQLESLSSTFPANRIIYGQISLM